MTTKFWPEQMKRWNCCPWREERLWEREGEIRNSTWNKLEISVNIQMEVSGRLLCIQIGNMV